MIWRISGSVPSLSSGFVYWLIRTTCVCVDEQKSPCCYAEKSFYAGGTPLGTAAATSLVACDFCDNRFVRSGF